MTVGYLFALAVLAVAASVQASVGFGMNLLSIPVLIQIDPSYVPVPTLCLSAALNIGMLVRDRTSVSVREVGSAIVGRIPGTVLGVASLAVLSERGIAVIVAIVVIGTVLVSASGVVFRRTPPTLFTAGLLSGFGASTAGIGGPPVAILFQDAGGPGLRGSMGGFFLVGTTVTLIGLALGGHTTTNDLVIGLSLLPAVVVGFAMSGRLVPVLDRGWTRPAVLSLSAIAAVVLVVRLIAEG